MVWSKLKFKRVFMQKYFSHSYNAMQCNYRKIPKISPSMYKPSKYKPPKPALQKTLR